MPAAVWIVLGLLLLLVLGGSKGKNAGHSGEKTRNGPVRIDRIHYMDPDEHECSACGARFRGKGMVCPRCGARFAGVKKDGEEFTEEMLFWDDDGE